MTGDSYSNVFNANSVDFSRILKRIMLYLMPDVLSKLKKSKGNAPEISIPNHSPLTKAQYLNHGMQDLVAFIAIQVC